MQQKRRRVYIQRQAAVETENAKLLKDFHFRRFVKNRKKFFFQPQVITVKKD